MLQHYTPMLLTTQLKAAALRSAAPLKKRLRSRSHRALACAPESVCSGLEHTGKGEQLMSPILQSRHTCGSSKYTTGQATTKHSTAPSALLPAAHMLPELCQAAREAPCPTKQQA